MKPTLIFLSCCTVIAMVLAAGAGQLFKTENVSPKLRLEFQTQPVDGPKVQEFFVRFARAEGLAVTDWTSKMPPKDGRSVFNLELRRNDTMTVKVNNIVREDQYFVFVYELHPDHAFTRIVSRLVNQLKEKWPSTRSYNGQ